MFIKLDFTFLDKKYFNETFPVIISPLDRECV